MSQGFCLHLILFTIQPTLAFLHFSASPQGVHYYSLSLFDVYTFFASPQEVNNAMIEL